MAAHPLHPALVHFPLGLLLTATLADLAQLAGIWSEPRFTAWLMVAGVAAALPTMAAGSYDFRRLNENQARHALRHMGAASVAWLGYAVALYLRRDVFTGAAGPSAASIAVGLAGAAALAVTGWLGGELVYRHGAGRIEP